MWERMRSHRESEELRREGGKIEASGMEVIRLWEENCNWSGDGKCLKEARMFQKQQSKVTNTLTPPLCPSIHGSKKNSTQLGRTSG